MTTTGHNSELLSISLDHDINATTPLSSQRLVDQAQIGRMLDWMSKGGEINQRKLLIQVIQRCPNRELLEYLVRILRHFIESKDVTYARSRFRGTFADRCQLEDNGALDDAQNEEFIQQSCDWFQETNHHNKVIFFLRAFRVISLRMLHLVICYVNTLILAKDIDTSGQQEEPSANADACEEERRCREQFTQIGINSSEAYSGIARHKDFIKLLPVHVSKKVLSMLDKRSHYNALCVSDIWRALCEEVKRDASVHANEEEEMLLLQGSVAVGCNPVYANDIDVLVPNVHPDTLDVLKEELSTGRASKNQEGQSFEYVYQGISTRRVIMEERNVFCGSYNVMVLINKQDSKRSVHFDGYRKFAIGSHDRKVYVHDTVTGGLVCSTLRPHAGSVKCVRMCEESGFAASGSYDTSIRFWSVKDGKCLKIFQGHKDTVNCIDICGILMASGSSDHTCKVWDMDEKRCLWTFKHKKAISVVSINDEYCVSGCEAGFVKMWYLKNGQHVKTLTGHQSEITGIKFDRWHIVTSSKDKYAMAWSAQGKYNGCLTALRHPCTVLSLEFLYLRVLTGAGDGKIRVWNVVTGDCLKVLRGSSSGDPIRSLVAAENRILINTQSNVIMMSFEPVEWDYTLGQDTRNVISEDSALILLKAGKKVRPTHAEMRARRLEFTGGRSSKLKMETSLGGVRAQSARPRSKLSGYDEVEDERAPSPAERARSASMATAKKVTIEEPPKVPSTPSLLSFVKTGLASEPPPSSPFPGGTPFNIPSLPDRRISWSFEQRYVPKDKPLTREEMQQMFRSQIRSHEEKSRQLYQLTYSVKDSLQDNEQTSEGTLKTKKETNYFIQNQNIQMIRKNRPFSSPARLNSKLKVPKEETNYKQFLPSEDEEERAGTAGAVGGAAGGDALLQRIVAGVEQEEGANAVQIITGYEVKKVAIRPHSSYVQTSSQLGRGGTGRPKSAIGQFQTTPLQLPPRTPATPSVAIANPHRVSNQLVTSASNLSASPIGAVSPFNHPLRNHVDFKLLTYTQINKQLIPEPEEAKKSVKQKRPKSAYP